jgi:hypothetical protein
LIKLKKEFRGKNNTRILKGYYACIEASIKIQRDLSAYINDIYLPSTFIVGLSFISFHIDHKSAPARAPLGVMSVLSKTKRRFFIKFNMNNIFFGFFELLQQCTKVF